MADVLAVVRFPPAAASQIANALERHARWCRDNGGHLHDDVVAFLQVVSNGQDRPTSCNGDGTADDGRMSPLLYTHAEVAERLRVSERTVRRLVAAGELRPVEVAARVRRVHHVDLDIYTARLRAAGRSTPC